jgi:hypothetical protein
MSDQIPGAPPAIAAALDRLKVELTVAARENLVGLVLYGGLARGRYRPGKSDVNVVILLREASAATLDAIVGPLQNARHAIGVEPMILTPAEIPQAVDAFPTKFLDIQDHHIVLVGAEPDPFAHLQVSKELVRLRVSQELRNMLFRLRHRYVSAAKDITMLARTLAEVVRPIALALGTLLDLANKETPDDDRSAVIFDAAAKAFGLDQPSLARLADFRQDPRQTKDLPALFAAVLNTLEKAADITDRMKETS